MSKRAEDVVRRTSAASHADQPGPDKKKAGRWGTSRRTQNRWKHDGPPQIRDAQLYLLNSPNPHRALATLKVAQKQAHMRTLLKADLIARYREVVQMDKHGEAEDTNHDLCSETPWLDRALSSERDAALDAEKAAIEREFAVRGVSLEEVRS